MPVYQIETDDGKEFEIETQVEIDDPKALGELAREAQRLEYERDSRAAMCPFKLP
jgi:hypothetical protein